MMILRFLIITALHLGGRNVTKTKLEELWKSSSKNLDLEEFSDLCREVKVTTEGDILKAFKKFDVNGDGFITRRELSAILTEKGDMMTKDEVDNFFETFDVDGNGRLDYREFVAMVMTTQEESRRAGERNYEKFMRDRGRAGSTTYVNDDDDDDHGSDDDDVRDHEPSKSRSSSSGKTQFMSGGLSQLSVLEKPKHFKECDVLRRFGSFYFYDEPGVDEVVIKSHHFVVEVHRNTLAWISIQPIITKDTDLNKLLEKNDLNLDMMVFVLNSKGELVAFSDDRRAKGKSCLTVELMKGTYRLIVHTSGIHYKTLTSDLRQKSNEQRVQLIARMGESYLITSTFRETLCDIFKSFDTRCRDLLDKADFGLYTKLTCGDDEELHDEDWEIVIEKVHTIDGMVSERGFVELHELDAMDSFGDETDFWDTLFKLGYDGRLHLVKASQYSIEICSESSDIDVDVEKISTFSEELNRPITSLIKSHGDKRKSRANKDIFVYTFVTRADAHVLVENQGSRTIIVTVDCTKSENMISHRGSLNYTSKISSKSSLIFHHLLPLNENLKWSFLVNESILK